MGYPNEKIQQRWIQEKVDDAAVNWAKSFGEYLQSEMNQSKPLTTSQIRKFFGELKRIQADPEKYQDDVPLLKAKLAYAVGRETVSNYGRISVKTKIKEFYEELEKGINFIRNNEKKDLINFVKLIEAIVAYHKYYGGK
jgi:CRISPR-associated protein Csm2